MLFPLFQKTSKKKYNLNVEVLEQRSLLSLISVVYHTNGAYTQAHLNLNPLNASRFPKETCLYPGGIIAFTQCECRKTELIENLPLAEQGRLRLRSYLTLHSYRDLSFWNTHVT